MNENNSKKSFNIHSTCCCCEVFAGELLSLDNIVHTDNSSLQCLAWNMFSIFKNLYSTECLKSLQICRDCFERLSNCYDFYKNCIENNNILNKLINQWKDFELGDHDYFEITSTLESAPLNTECEEETKSLPSISETEANPPEDKITPAIDNTATCKLCDKEFPSEKSLGRHLYYHQTKEGLDCGYCNKSFKYQIHLSKHQITHKTNVCCYCNNGFRDTEEMLQHINKMHTDFMFLCNYCPKKCKTTRDLRKHNRGMHDDSKIYYYCGICDVTGNLGRNFELHEDLLAHLKNDHDVKSTTESIADEATDALDFVYEFLNEPFEGIENDDSLLNDFLKLDARAQKSAKRRKIKLSKQQYDDPNLEMDTVPTYPCPKCYDLNFTDLQELKLHMAHDHDVNILMCNECGTAFNRIEDYKVHCDDHYAKNAIEKADLPPSKPNYNCGICDKNLKTISGLKYHVKKHNGHKSFECPYCDTKKFLSSINLNAHIKFKHSMNKAYACKKCDKKFSTLDSYKKHHHDREKKFACEFCDKVYYQQCHLNEHYWSHTDLKPHFCTLCKKSFTSKSSLNYHLSKAHKDTVGVE